MSTGFTKPYKVAPREYLGAISRSLIERLWWLLLIPSALFLAGFHDWRWAAIGLIVLMLIYPALITTSLLTDAMRPEVIRRSASRRASITDNHITIYKETTSDDGSISYEPIETAEIVEIQYAKNITKVILSPTSPANFILIPTDCMPPV